MIITEEAYLAHYGILRKSGRYPWGSGETQSARNRSFLDTIDGMRKEGMSEAEIARSFSTNEDPFTTSDLRALKSIALNQQRQERIATAQKYHDKGMSNVEIGRRMGLNESSVRNLLDPLAANRADRIQNTAEMLKRQIQDKGFIDVGTMAAAHIGVNDTALKTAIASLAEEGFIDKVHYIKIPQVGTGELTTMKVLAPAGTPWKEVNAAALEGRVSTLQEHTENFGETFTGIQPPIHIDSSRIGVTYKEDGGAEADGVIYVRPGVPDLDMGGKRYAQVRIAVDGTHYLKGMAVLKDDLPEGMDLVFNTNKSNTGNKLDAMKPLSEADNPVQPNNPFGAIVRQLPKLDEQGREIDGTVRSALNIVNDEGDWDKWSRNLSTQFLSKQSPTLARQQLDMTYERKQNELNEIMSLTNPTVKKQLLMSFADDADSSAVHLKAQALPRQRTQVILPISSLKENEIYAPNFKSGERVVLVRHPHGGTFEIPELVVNNRNKEGKSLLGSEPQDAVGINHKVAERLSGADFDGDTVLVIPNDSGAVRTERALEGLKNFNPQERYAPYDGMKTIDGGTYNAATKKVDYGENADGTPRLPKGGPKQNQMGLVSNLITDMTIKGASHDELAAAVRHSMVVIDAEKHSLDYKRSAIENGIPALKKKYQGTAQGGASTLISLKKREIAVPARKPRPAAEGGAIDKATGKKMYVPTNEVSKKTGEVLTTKVKKILEVDSAREMSSGTVIENLYADHSDRLQSLANKARKEAVNTKPVLQSPSAKQTYAPEVKSLKAKLAVAELNAPRERDAQRVANSIISTLKASNPTIEKGDLKKLSSRALLEARDRTGAKKARVEITPKEWDAIQAGAVSNNTLERILRNTNLEEVKKLATPRTPTVMTDAMQTRAKSMLAAGFTQADVAAQLGVALSTMKSSVVDKG